jgi:hypothetical protein
MTFNIKTDIKFELYLPASGDFVLGVSKLGVDKLSSSAGSWVDIAANLASLDTSVGPQVLSGIYTQTDPGMISATFQSATYDPNFNGRVRVGVNIRIQVYQAGAWFYMFRGRISDLSVVYNYDGSNVVTLQAYDYLQRFLNETSGDTFYAPIGTTTGLTMERLAQSIPAACTIDMDGGYAGVDEYYLGADYSVGDLANKCLLAELGLLWYESSNDTLYFKNRLFVADALTGSAIYAFSDVHSTATSHVCFTDLRIGASTDQLANKIIATYFDGTGRAVSVNGDSYGLYGPQILEIAVPVWDGGTGLRDWAIAVRKRPIQKTVQEIVFKGVNRAGELYSATKVKVGDVVSVVKTIGSNTIDEKFVVTNVRHSINPDVWQTTLELWKGI